MPYQSVFRCLPIGGQTVRGLDFLLAGIIISFLITTLISIRFGLVSARIGGIVMLVSPCIVNAIFVIWKGGDLVDMICMGLLLSVAFGPATFIAGRRLEAKAKNDNIIDNR